MLQMQQLSHTRRPKEHLSSHQKLLPEDQVGFTEKMLYTASVLKDTVTQRSSRTTIFHYILIYFYGYASTQSHLRQ